MARFALAALLGIGLSLVSAVAVAQDAGGPPTSATASAPPRPKPALSASKPKGSSAPGAASAPSGAPAASAVPTPSASASVPESVPAADAAPSAAPAASVEPEPSAAPVASVAPPAEAASTEPEPKAIAAGSSVRYGDDPVFAIRTARGGRTAEGRAAEATKALARAAVGAKGSDVRVQRKDDVAIVLVGQTPIVQLVLDDAKAAGDTSLDVHAATVAAAVRDAIESERKRAAIAKSVFSISLLVFLGLIAFYLVQKVGEFAQRARVWVEQNGERVLAVRVRRIEVVSPGTVRSTAIVGLSVGKWIAQVGIVYTWLVVVLSLFDATRGYTQRLTGFVVTPLSELMARIAMGLPMLVVLVIAGFAVFVLVRFVGLFFTSVGRRETVVAWIPPDLVAPVSSLVRFAIVVAALVVLAPLVTGSSEGALARAGWIVLFSLGLAAAPVLASGLLGAVVLFGRKLRAGQCIEVGPHRGRISAIGLLELSLEDEDGVEVRVPHLYALARPTRVIGLRPRYVLELALSPDARPSEVRETLARVAATFDLDHKLTLMSADSERALYRLSFASDRPEARSELQSALLEALTQAKIPLGRLSTAPRGA